MKKKIYLCGGFHSLWQERVVNKLQEHYILINPKDNKMCKDPKIYTKRDIKQIRESDILLANLEDDNPGLFALCSEIGFAFGLKKEIIIVNGLKYPTTSTGFTTRYFDFTLQLANKQFKTIEEANSYLSSKYKIRNCPFCGSEAKLIETDDGSNGYHVEYQYNIECCKNEMHYFYGTPNPEETIAMWNERYDDEEQEERRRQIHESIQIPQQPNYK